MNYLTKVMDASWLCSDYCELLFESLKILTVKISQEFHFVKAIFNRIYRELNRKQGIHKSK
jgi:hypothetical protein